MKGVETLRKNFVEFTQRGGMVSGEECIDQSEAVVVIQDVEVFHHLFGLYVVAAERNGLVENRKGVAHRSIGLHRDYVQGLILYLDALLAGDIPQIADDVGYADASEVISLAARQDGGQNLVLFGGGEDEDGVCRGFLEGFQEGVESGLAEHMYLIDDEYAVFSDLRGNVHLVDKGFDIVDRIVRCGIQLVYAI